MRSNTYYVWKRSDGYVGASNGCMPSGSPFHTFSHLLTTTDWGEAEKLIREERKRIPHWLHE